MCVRVLISNRLACLSVLDTTIPSPSWVCAQKNIAPTIPCSSPLKAWKVTVVWTGGHSTSFQCHSIRSTTCNKYRKMFVARRASSFLFLVCAYVRFKNIYIERRKRRRQNNNRPINLPVNNILHIHKYTTSPSTLSYTIIIYQHYSYIHM